MRRMIRHTDPGVSRRHVIGAGLGLVAAPALSRLALASGGNARQLVAQPIVQALVGPPHPDTPMWGYDGASPGPLLRYPQGARLEIEFENRLPVETTVHWHGIRLPNAMDGVPHLTQPPVPPGGRFRYAFDLPDAGTYWYHPHLASHEQLGRGLAGALIVDEPDPPEVDRDLVWLLSDYRLRPDATIVEDFGNFRDISHDGRIGNTVTINGRLPADLKVRAGERLRLRLINAANARIFALDFQGHAPQVIALDGHAVTPFAPEAGRVVLAPGERCDLIVDCLGDAGQRHAVIDDRYRTRAYRLLDIVYDEGQPKRRRPLDRPFALPTPKLPAPDLTRAEALTLTLGGGMMSGQQGAEVGGRFVEMREMLREHRLAWALNGQAMAGHDHDRPPLFALKRDASYRMTIVNETAWAHPMHLHGHVFRVLARNGQAASRAEWRDTLLIEPRQTAEIAFRADNPGDWMVHCHVLEHQHAGMMAWLRIA